MRLSSIRCTLLLDRLPFWNVVLLFWSQQKYRRMIRSSLGTGSTQSTRLQNANLEVLFPLLVLQGGKRVSFPVTSFVSLLVCSGECGAHHTSRSRNITFINRGGIRYHSPFETRSPSWDICSTVSLSNRSLFLRIRASLKP
jgi:hypothetical protein